MLTEEEAKAVDRWRSQEYNSLETEQLDLYLLADAVDRLYPPGWNDPVTPERLVELGGVVKWNDSGLVAVSFASGASMTIYKHEVDSVDVGDMEECQYIPDCCFPRNMKEARELLERCGAIKEAT